MKKIVLFVILILLAVGGFAVYQMKKQTTVPVITQTTIVPTVTPTPTRSVNSGNTNADLDKDAQDVSTKLNAINNDASNIDQGMNEQQGNLSEQ